MKAVSFAWTGGVLMVRATRRRLTMLATTLLVTVLTITTAGPAAAQDVVYGEGGDYFAAIYCSPGLIRLGLPTIWVIPAGDSISSRKQMVAWTVTIWTSADPSTGWIKTNAVPYWYAGYVNDRYLGLYYNTSWYSAQFQQWLDNSPPYWTIGSNAYYAATMELVWWMPDGTVTTGSTQLWAYGLGTGGLWSDRSPYCYLN